MTSYGCITSRNWGSRYEKIYPRPRPGARPNILWADPPPRDPGNWRGTPTGDGRKYAMAISVMEKTCEKHHGKNGWRVDLQLIQKHGFTENEQILIVIIYL